MVNTNRANGDRPHAERVHNIAPNRLARLRTEPLHPPGRVVARKRCKVNATHSLQEPRRLMGFLHRAPRSKGSRTTLDRRCIGLYPRHPVQIKWQPRIARLGCLGQLRQLVLLFYVHHFALFGLGQNVSRVCPKGKR